MFVTDLPSVLMDRKRKDPSATLPKKKKKRKGNDNRKDVDPLKEFEVPEKSVELYGLNAAHPNAAVTVNFTQLRPVCSLLEVLSNVLQDCEFKIIHEETKRTGLLVDSSDRSSFSGLKTQCINSNKTCLILFKLHGDVILSENHEESDLSFKLYRNTGDAGVFLKAFSRYKGNRRYRHIRLNSLELGDEDEAFDIQDIDFDFNVVLEVSEIRKIIRLSRSMRCRG